MPFKRFLNEDSCVIVIIIVIIPHFRQGDGKNGSCDGKDPKNSFGIMDGESFFFFFCSHLSLFVSLFTVYPHMLDLSHTQMSTLINCQGSLKGLKKGWFQVQLWNTDLKGG